MKKEFLTCEDMLDLYNNCYQSVYHVIEKAEDFKQSYPATPYKPRLKDNANSTEVKEYAKLLEEYEEAYKQYELNKYIIDSLDNTIDNEIEAFIKEVSELNTIPEKSRDKVWHKAWQDAHSSGLYSVYQQLCELVGLF